jgi:3-carboxy-cis,cis-muconate cycloisomerase
MSDSLFGPMYGRPAGAAEVVQALLQVEAALAAAQALAGVIPAAAAEAIAANCRVDRFDIEQLARRSVASATPIVPLVEDLRALVPAEHRASVHKDATSQDILDTALGLVAARSLDEIAEDLTEATASLAALARDHRQTVQMGRTLLRDAVPTTFGMVCDGWRGGVDEALGLLRRVRHERLAVQFGGPVGALVQPEVVDAMAQRLGLVAPPAPWQTQRVRIAELACALGITLGSLGKIAQDVLLLGQDALSEVAEGGAGASSSMPHKKNAAMSVLIVAAAHRGPGLVATVLSGMPQELQRAAGRWQAEWPVVAELLALTGSAAQHTRTLLAGLRVDATRMHTNALSRSQPGSRSRLDQG